MRTRLPTDQSAQRDNPGRGSSPSAADVPAAMIVGNPPTGGVPLPWRPGFFTGRNPA